MIEARGRSGRQADVTVGDGHTVFYQGPNRSENDPTGYPVQPPKQILETFLENEEYCHNIARHPTEKDASIAILFMNLLVKSASATKWGLLLVGICLVISCWDDLQIIPINKLDDVVSKPSGISVLDSKWDAEPMRLCREPRIQHGNFSLPLLYQCAGREYQHFTELLYDLAEEESIRRSPTYAHSTWGRQTYPLPDHTSVLILGNSHLRQISKTLLCQYADRIRKIHFADDNSAVVEFENDARLILVTNTVLMYSKSWPALIEAAFLSPYFDETVRVHTMDAIVLGKFTHYQEARHTQYENTMKIEESAFYERHPGEKRIVDFQQIDPPELTNVVEYVLQKRQEVMISYPSFGTPPPMMVLSVPMFSQSDQIRALLERKRLLDRNIEGVITTPNFRQQTIQQQGSNNLEDDDVSPCQSRPSESNPTSMIWTCASGIPTPQVIVDYVATRTFIEQLGLECGSDDKYSVGNCQEDNLRRRLREILLPPRVAADMHRCAGSFGGHADLVAFDMAEALQSIQREPFH